MKFYQLLPFFIVSCAEEKENIEGNLSINNRLDTYIENAMATFDIPGASVAVIKNNKVVYKNNFGYTSIEDSRSVDDNTIVSNFFNDKIIYCSWYISIY